MSRYRLTNWYITILPSRNCRLQEAAVILMGHVDRSTSGISTTPHRGTVSEMHKIPLTPDILACDDLHKEVLRRAIIKSHNAWAFDEPPSSPQDVQQLSELHPLTSASKLSNLRGIVQPLLNDGLSKSASGPTIGSSQAQPEPPTFALREYPGRVILAMDSLAVLTYLTLIIGIVMISPDQFGATWNPLLSIATSALLIGTIGLMLIDWRGFWSIGITVFQYVLRHTVASDVQAGAIASLVLCFPIVMLFGAPIYLAKATNAYFAAKRLEPLKRKRKIAELEAQLGLMPQTAGSCQSCGKPLQVGAEFCSYCGASTVPKPRICPNCATAALPDARFCSKCRTELGNSTTS